LKTIIMITSLLLLTVHLFGQDSLEELITKGDEAYKSFDNQSALEWYQKAIDSDSTSYEAAWKLARAFVDVGENLEGDEMHKHYMSSQKYAQQAIRQNEEGSNGHLFLSIALGRVALQAGAKERMRLAKSIRVEAEAAIELDNTNDIAYHVLGRWHRRLADLSWIEKGFANVFLGGVPKDATVENSHKNFQKAIDLNPSKISHHLEMGITYLAMDDKKKATEEFNKVLELPQSDSDDTKHKESAKKFLEDLN